MAKTYETIISVLDKFSAPILGLEDKLAKLGNVGASTQHKLNMSPTVKLWSQLTNDVSAAKAKFSELGQSIGNIGGALTEVLPMLGALGAGASVAGLLEMAHATAEAEEALHNMALITGMAMPQLQSLGFAAQQSGIPLDQLGAGLEKLNVAMGKASEGKNKQALALFHAMGINLRDANGHLKNANQILPQIEASFQKTTDPALRAAMAVQLFGKSGEDLLPFLTQGPAAIAQLQAQFDKFGYKFSDSDSAGLEAFNTGWRDATLAVQGLRDEIGAKLAPVMAPLLVDFATFVAANRDIIALDLKGALTAIGDDVKKIDFKTIGGDAEAFMSDISGLVNDVGGLKTVMEIAGGAMAASFVAPILTAGVAVVGLGASLADVALGPVVALGAGFVELLPAVTGVRDVMAALDIAMAANPLGVAVLAAAALATAGYKVYENWKPIEDFFARIGGEIEDFGKKVEDFDQSLGLQFGGGGPGAPRPRGRFAELGGGLNAGGGGANGKVDVTLHLPNLPPGAAVIASSSGAVNKPVVNTGRNGTISNHR